MQDKLKIEERILLLLLKAALCVAKDSCVNGNEFHNSHIRNDIIEELNKYNLSLEQWSVIVGLAKKHAVLSLLYDCLKQCRGVPQDVFERVEMYSRQIVQQNFRLLFLTKYIVKILEENGIHVLVFKGPAAAVYYPVPELRKSGDVDIIVSDSKEFELACKILKDNGYKAEEVQRTNHHIAFLAPDNNIEIELHSLLAEPFDNNQINEYLEDIIVNYKHGDRKECFVGVFLPIPKEAENAFSLLLHMLQHFLRAGFGLKLLADWVVFWNRECWCKDNIALQSEKQRFKMLVEEAGLMGFCQMITSICCEYIGLDKGNVDFILSGSKTPKNLELFMAEIIEAQEFGKSQKDRMVGLRGTSIADYCREFHHQMQLNHPKCKKIVVIWPVMWLITLAVFIRNNRKLRKVSSVEILKKAGNRGSIISEMRLFKK